MYTSLKAQNLNNNWKTSVIRATHIENSFFLICNIKNANLSKFFGLTYSLLMLLILS